MKTEAVLCELEKIRRGEGGLLNPVSVVTFARNPVSSLHGYFEWDDTAAAEQHRLEQARRLIRACIHVIKMPDGADTIVPVFISLPGDRVEGGYRVLAEVMASSVLRESALTMVLAELARINAKVAQFKELARIYEEINIAVRKHTTKTRAERKPDQEQVASV